MDFCNYLYLNMKRLLCISLLIAISALSQAQFLGIGKKKNKIETQPAEIERLFDVIDMIGNNYVDVPNNDKLSEAAINAMLKTLDPHSIYIPAKDVERTNEALVGNFEGVGITFQIVNDTIMVSDVIAGGPSEEVGLAIGDKIVRIDGLPATGDSVNNTFVTSHLRGKKGSIVVLDILRMGKIYSFSIRRDKIPIYSIDSYFMADDTIGYVRLVRFSRTSVTEFRKAVDSLKAKGMKSLILDLRGNGGGYLDIACGMANEFLKQGSLLVYTEGRKSKRQNFRANRNGCFRQGDLVVLIDEGSASASEIVSGAIQDYDRGTLVGRRSFGKGLVQHMFPLKDGGQVRLTTARYYTPSGRCIQKPYDAGADAYREDINNRFKHDELVNADSIHFPDSLKYKTASGRTVYGGGGIMPDVFVPMDTMRLTDFYINLRAKGVLNNFAAEWANQHRGEALVRDFDTYMQNYELLHLDSLLEVYAASKDVVRDTAKEYADSLRSAHSDFYLRASVKALVARGLFGTEYYFMVMRDIDEAYLKALSILRKESNAKDLNEK